MKNIVIFAFVGGVLVAGYILLINMLTLLLKLIANQAEIKYNSRKIKTN